MTSLIGLLLGASPARRQELARRWAVESDADTGHLVTNLYRRITDDWLLQSFLERVPPDQLLILERVAREPSGKLPLAQLLRRLPFDEARASAAVAGLAETALLATAGAPPVLSIPDDLHAALRRLLQKRGDEGGNRTLHHMLWALDLPDLQHLGDRWRLPNAHALYKRDLVVRLELILAAAPEVDGALSTLVPAAGELFRVVQGAGGVLGLDDVTARLGVAETALRAAFEALHALFLLHSGYDARRRCLYAPVGVASSSVGAGGAREAPPLVEVREPQTVIKAEDGLLEDLARLLAGVAGGGSAPAQRSARGDGEAPADRPPAAIHGGDRLAKARAGYAQRCAVALGLIEARDGRLARTPVADDWTALDRERQSVALHEVWLSDRGWQEPLAEAGLGRRKERPARLDRVRQHLRLWLADGEPGTWYSVRSLLERVRWGPRFGQQMVAPEGTRTNVEAARRELVAVAVLSVGFHWLGGVDLGRDEQGRLRAFRLTPRGRRLLGQQPAATPPQRVVRT